MIAGRREGALRNMASQLEGENWPHPARGTMGAGAANPVGCAVTDVTDSEALRRTLCEVQPAVVVHTAGPFQGNADYLVAKTCIEHGCHYCDIADDREYVKGFNPTLDEMAKTHGVTALSGCSTTPGLVSAVVSAHLHEVRSPPLLHNSCHTFVAEYFGGAMTVCAWPLLRTMPLWRLAV